MSCSTKSSLGLQRTEFLSISGDDSVGGMIGQLEPLLIAIMEGWTARLGVAITPSTIAFGQLLYEYLKRVYASQLLHLQDILIADDANWGKF